MMRKSILLTAAVLSLFALMVRAASHVDLDITSFTATKRVSLSKVKPIKIKLSVRNLGAAGGSVSAVVTGEVSAVGVYSETLPVSDPVGGGPTKFIFPAYTPTISDIGDITWTVTITDDDPDVDVAVAVTKVVP